MFPRLLGLTLALLGPPLLATSGEPLGGGAPAVTAAVAGQAALVAICAAVLVIWRRWQGKPFSAMGLCPLRWESIALGVALAVFFMFVFLPFTSFVFTRLGLAWWDEGVADSGHSRRGTWSWPSSWRGWSRRSCIAATRSRR